MPLDAPNLNHLWARLLVEELRRQGVAHFVVAPGSRSTPLAMAVAARAPQDYTVHFDERGAAFHALGWARATGRPAVVITTSGSAAANLWPAVVEARAACIPLILVTADRPSELLECGANQAIDQVKLFGDYTRWNALLPCPDRAIPPQYVLGAAAHAAHRAADGPVHLNCAFREPLAPVATGEALDEYTAPIARWIQSGRPFASWVSPAAPAAGDLEEIAAHIRGAQRGLLLIGQLPDAAAQAAASALAKDLGWPVFADVASGLRMGAAMSNRLAYYDQLLLGKEFRAACTPDLVVHIGGPLVSKRLAGFLADVRPLYIHVSDAPFRQDPAHMVAYRVAGGVAAACAALAGAIGLVGPRPWGKALRAWEDRVADTMKGWLAARAPFGEMAIARAVSQLRPEGSVLFLGNSMPVRDMDMYGDPGGPPGPVYANRGASGIDGNLAFAAGLAAAAQRPATAVIGDLATLHDLNSLALLRELKTPFVPVAINNDGGGIFHFLPTAECTPAAEFESLFGTPHGLGFEDAARLFGLRYHRPADMDSFAGAYGDAIGTPGATLIEVRTDRNANAADHRALQEHLRQAVDALARPV